jgi:hypothetical protein
MLFDPATDPDCPVKKRKKFRYDRSLCGGNRCDNDRYNDVGVSAHPVHGLQVKIKDFIQFDSVLLQVYKHTPKKATEADKPMSRKIGHPSPSDPELYYL